MLAIHNKIVESFPANPAVPSIQLGQVLSLLWPPVVPAKPSCSYRLSSKSKSCSKQVRSQEHLLLPTCHEQLDPFSTSPRRPADLAASKHLNALSEQAWPCLQAPPHVAAAEEQGPENSAEAAAAGRPAEATLHSSSLEVSTSSASSPAAEHASRGTAG